MFVDSVASFLIRVLSESWELLWVPFVMPEIWWVITPLLVLMVITTLYFAEHPWEKIGWNTALTNSTVLVFIGIDLLRHIYHYIIPPTLLFFLQYPYRSVIVLIVMLEGVLLSMTAFRHAISERWMFFIASPLIVNTQALVVVILVYSRVRLTLYTLLAMVVVFFVIYAAFLLLRIIGKRFLLRGTDVVVQ